MANKHPTLTVEEDIEQTARMLRTEWHLAPERLTGALAGCILELPHKRAHYVSLLRKLCQTDRANNGEAHCGEVRAILEAIVGHFRESCEKGGPWRHASQAILALAAAVRGGVLARTALDRVYGGLFEIIPSVGVSTADFIVWMLSAVALLYDRQQVTLLSNIKTYMLQRSQLSQPMPRDLLVLTELLADDGAILEAASGPELGDNPNIDIEFQLSSFTLDTRWDDDYAPLQLGNDDGETATPLEQWHSLYNCRVLAESLELNHRRCAESLLVAAKSERSAAIFLFGELIRQRRNGLPNLVYESLMLDCCRLERAFPPAMARILHALYGRLDDKSSHSMLGCPWLAVERLSSWFSHHLSNFDYKWNWAAWQSVLEAPSTSLRVAFVRMTVEKLVRLSFYERVAPTLSGGFRQAFLPPEPKPHFSEEEAELTALLVKAIEQRQSVEQVRDLLPKEDLDTGHHEALLQALLTVGSKSLSHALAVIERYLPLFQILVGSGGSGGSNTTTSLARTKANFFILDQIASFWRHSQLHFEFVVERLVNYRILLPTAVMRWCLERADEQLAALDSGIGNDDNLTISSPSIYQIIVCRLSHNLLLRTLQQAANMPTQAQQRMRDGTAEKVAGVMASLTAEFEEALVVAVERLALLPVQLVSLSNQVIDLATIVCTDYLRELAFIYRPTLASLMPQIAQRLGTRIPAPVSAILEQITSQ